MPRMFPGLTKSTSATIDFCVPARLHIRPAVGRGHSNLTAATNLIKASLRLKFFAIYEGQSSRKLVKYQPVTGIRSKVIVPFHVVETVQ